MVSITLKDDTQRTRTLSPSIIMNKQKIYFPNLNGLRFIAAFLVIVQHIEQIKSIFKIENYWETVLFIDIIGKLGVVLFFVLSGFLITYLLLVEEQSFKQISIRKFYIRRMLRIWPLYFLIIILAFFVLPNIDLFTWPNYSKEVIHSNLFLKLLLYAVFFPNLAVQFLGIVPYATHTWSIGTEEQYYLIWPVILKYVKKNRIGLMIFIIAFYLSFKFFLQSPYLDILPFKDKISGFWALFNIDCMAIGGLFAVLLFQKNKLLKLLQNNFLFYSTTISTIILILNGVQIPNFHYEFYSILFGIIILNFATNDTIKISLENKIFNYLGNISYGLYMYHPIGIALALYLCRSLNVLTNWLIYPLSVIVTILLAGLSYKYFESFFLRFKDKFSNIISGSRN